ARRRKARQQASGALVLCLTWGTSCRIKSHVRAAYPATRRTRPVSRNLHAPAQGCQGMALAFPPRDTMRAHRLYGPSPEEPEPLRPVPDLEGTPVVDVEGHSAGTVHGSLAEERSGLIRYLDVALDEDNRHVLVPLGHVRLERERGRPLLHLLGATREELHRIPPYDGERRVDESYGRRIARAHGKLFHGERYYAHPAYDHRGLYAGDHPILRGPGIPHHRAPLQPLSTIPD